MEKLVVGVDIGGTHFRVGAVDERLNVRCFEKLPVTAVLHGGDVLADLAEYLKNFISRLDAPVCAAALGFPAPLDKQRRVVLQAPNISFMAELPVVERLEAELGMPVFIERDVNMLLTYDTERHGIAPEGVTCAFYFGTGLGNAISIDGRIYVGRNGAAGELGHIPADGSEEQCGCGNVGCIENLAAGKYLTRLAREKYTDTAIENLFTCHGEDEELLRFVDRMAMAAAAELNILDPDHVLIGGGVVDMRGFPREFFEQRLYAHCRKPYPAETLQLCYTSGEDEKGVVGAAIYAMNSMK